VKNLNLKELFIALVRRPDFGWRTLIMFTSITLAVSLYVFIVDFYDPESNVFSSFNFFPKKQEFFSGSPGGFYITLGTELANELEKNDYDINLKNKITAGGHENAINVLVTPNSYGLVQEEIIKKSDFIRERINYIAPLYMSRMHVLYRYDKAETLVENTQNSEFKISSNLNNKTRKFFSQATVSTGPVGSSSRIISSHLLNHINTNLSGRQENESKRIENNLNSVAYSIMDGLKGLKNGDIDVVFLITGSPVESVRKALEYNGKDKDGNIVDIRLMSIEPSMVSVLNRDYNLNLRMSDFKRKYTNTLKNKNISTLGFYTFLVSSKDVSSSDVMELVGALHNIKGNVKNIINLPDDNSELFQLDEFDFFESFKSDNSKSTYTSIKKFILFLVSVVATTALVVTFLVWVISGIKQNFYFQKIYFVVDACMPPSLGVEYNNTHFPVPVVKINSTEEVSNLVKGLNLLMEITQTLHKDYQKGGITDTHFSFLIQNTCSAKCDFREKLYRHLKIYLERGNKLSDDDIVRYFSAGFIDNAQYSNLREIVADINVNTSD